MKRYARQAAVTVTTLLLIGLALLLYSLTEEPLVLSQTTAPPQRTIQQILNDVWDRTNRRLMTTPWAGAQGTSQSETYIFNDVWDSVNHLLRTSGSSSNPGGTGDVTSDTSVSVDNEMVLFSSTTGKVIKRATGTGLVKLTSGVQSFAAPGTDYVIPGGNVATATALAANGNNCPPGQFAAGVDAAGVAEGCADPLTGIPDPSIILTTTNVKKVSGKQLVPRVNPLVNTAGNVAFNCDDTDVGTLDNITSGITLSLPTCTGTNPEPEQEIEYRLQSTLPQTIAYNAAFCAKSGFALPTATSGDIASEKTYDRLKFRRNAVESCWSLIATTTGVGRGVTSLSPSTTYTCDWRIAHTCQMSYTAASTTIIVAAPPAVPADGTLTRYKFLCTSLQTLDWATAGVYVASPNVPFPTSCPADVTKYFIVGVERSSVLGKYQVIATN